MALNWTPPLSDSPKRGNGNPTTGAIVFGLLALGAGIWLSMQYAQMQELIAARNAFDRAPACTTNGTSSCRQMAPGKITDVALYNTGDNTNGGKSPLSGHLATCEIGVQVGADNYDEYMALALPCYSSYKGEHISAVLYNGALVSIDGAPTRENPDWAAPENALYLALAALVTVIGLTGAVFLGAKALAGS